MWRIDNIIQIPPVKFVPAKNSSCFQIWVGPVRSHSYHILVSNFSLLNLTRQGAILIIAYSSSTIHVTPGINLPTHKFWTHCGQLVSIVFQLVKFVCLVNSSTTIIHKHIPAQHPSGWRDAEGDNSEISLKCLKLSSYFLQAYQREKGTWRVTKRRITSGGINCAEGSPRKMYSNGKKINF